MMSGAERAPQRHLRMRPLTTNPFIRTASKLVMLIIGLTLLLGLAVLLGSLGARESAHNAVTDSLSMQRR